MNPVRFDRNFILAQFECQKQSVYRFPPTRAVGFCTFLVAFCFGWAFLVAGAVVVFFAALVAFFWSLAALETERKAHGTISLPAKHQNHFNNLLDGLFPLCLTNFWFHVSLSHDFCKGSADDGPLEFLCTACTFTGCLLFDSLLVFASVKNSPCYFTWITLHQIRSLAFLVEESEGLSKRKKRIDYRGYVYVDSEICFDRFDRLIQKHCRCHTFAQGLSVLKCVTNNKIELTFPSTLTKVLPCPG